MNSRMILTLGLICLLPASAVLAGEAEEPDYPNLELSITERFRLTSWDNAIDLSNDVDSSTTFTRLRTSFQALWTPREEVELTLKLTNEFRYYLRPEDREFTINEVFFDLLNVKWSEPGGLPGTLTLGRQNIHLGEGFVVMDGHGLDGSRSCYFNAIRFDWDIASDHVLTVFASRQDREDDALPIINDQDQLLVEQPEDGLAAYYSGEMGPWDLQGYYIYKHIEETHLRPDESDVHTVGARAVYELAPAWSATGEAAYQFGSLEHADRCAYGGYAHIDHRTDWPRGLPQTLTAGAVYLSGDDASTSDHEGWEPVFGRWPKWSESYIYTLISEGGVAYWSNLASVYATAKFEVSPEARFVLTYHHLMAPEKADSVKAFPGGDGSTRGDLVIGKLSCDINEHVSGHVLAEAFLPGNYYFDGADGYAWLRVELMFSF
jgi:Alginate export